MGLPYLVEDKGDLDGERMDEDSPLSTPPSCVRPFLILPERFPCSVGSRD
jgi:hypothetical protein